MPAVPDAAVDPAPSQPGRHPVRPSEHDATAEHSFPWRPPSPEPEAWTRVALATLSPRVDNGRFPVARTQGERVEVVAGVVVDGHEKVAAVLEWAYDGHANAEGGEVQSVRMPLRYNDEYVADFACDELGTYRYRVRAWLDTFGTWQDQFRRRVEGGAGRPELESELLDGATLLDARNRAGALDATIERFRGGEVEAALEDEVLRLAAEHDPAVGAVESDWLGVRVDPEWARFAAWYEFFPRSAADPGPDGEPVHGTLDDAAKRLPVIAERGFDVVYLPPISPIGETFRKGKDNAPEAQPGEVGSPWAVGGADGGHKSVLPELGGMEAFRRFVKKADELDLKVALDIAFQTSPDHPYVKEHPEWFRHRPDGTIRYAENPPKKYQDIYPIDFESEDWQALWAELRSVFEFWIGEGVRVFRVDNPHTKPLAFWEWCLGTLRHEHPDLVFLAEAFTKPKTMYGLAKRGFNNSYTYFTWRTTKEELVEYGEELFHTDAAEVYRPNFWPNTPDILTDELRDHGRPAHAARFVLAATLSSAYGIYGPPYEHVDHRQHPDREEYLDNEKYEVRAWNWDDPTSLQPLMKRVNRIRRENPALQHMRNVRFHETDNEHLIAYSKHVPFQVEDRGGPDAGGAASGGAGAGGDGAATPPSDSNLILTVVNLDYRNAQAGWVTLDLEALGLPADRPFRVRDLLGGTSFTWQGASNFVELRPHEMPAHVFRVETME